MQTSTTIQRPPLPGCCHPCHISFKSPPCLLQKYFWKLLLMPPTKNGQCMYEFFPSLKFQESLILPCCSLRMTCHRLHRLVEAKSSILLKGPSEASAFASLACLFNINFPSSHGFANTYCVELDFAMQELDAKTLNNLHQALLVLPYLVEFYSSFPGGLQSSWETLTHLVPTCIQRLGLKKCFEAVCFFCLTFNICNLS